MVFDLRWEILDELRAEKITAPTKILVNADPGLLDFMCNLIIFHFSFVYIWRAFFKANHPHLIYHDLIRHDHCPHREHEHVVVPNNCAAWANDELALIE